MKFRTLITDHPWPESGGGKIKRGADKHYRLCKNKDDLVLATIACPHLDVKLSTGVKKDIRPSEDYPGILEVEYELRGMADNAHWYLWVTNTYLPWGLWLMEKLGFTYKTNIIWNKPKIGLGQYFRGKHEICLFGIRGMGMDKSVYTGDRTLQSSYSWDYGRDGSGKPVHSKKPDEFYRLVEKRSHGPYLELFARRPQNDFWTCWGPDAGL